MIHHARLSRKEPEGRHDLCDIMKFERVNIRMFECSFGLGSTCNPSAALLLKSTCRLQCTIRVERRHGVADMHAAGVG